MAKDKKLPKPEELDVMALAYRRPKGKRPWFFDDPTVEKVLGITMAVAGELAVTRERLDAVERLLERDGKFDRKQIDSFTPDETTVAERNAWRQAYLTRILRVVTQALEGLERSPKKKS